MEGKFPGISAVAPAATTPSGHESGVGAERTRLAGIEAKAEVLKLRLGSLHERVGQLSELAPQIAQLERKKELEEVNYKYFGVSLEKARIDEALDPSKMPNISVVQKPSPAVWDVKARDRIVLGLACGGLVLGLVLAGFIELVLDRTIKRPLELETSLRIPLLLSIPNVARNGHRRLLSENGRMKCPSSHGARRNIGRFGLALEVTSVPAKKETSNAQRPTSNAE